LGIKSTVGIIVPIRTLKVKALHVKII